MASTELPPAFLAHPPPVDTYCYNHDRSRAKALSCPECCDCRAFPQEDELPSRAARHRPEFSENSRREDGAVGVRTWLSQPEQGGPATLGSPFKQSLDGLNTRSDIAKLFDPLENNKHPVPGRPGNPTHTEPYTRLVLQPETRPISQERLVAEVKGIYAGLVMVEAMCVDVDNKQVMDAQEAEPSQRPKLDNEQCPAIRRLASKYAMPARMWRHGIHSFLELLRHRLPDSLEHMLAFIYLAYSMMAFLFETVPTFEDTWIECLGDLGRYRMAIEDDDIRDREPAMKLSEKVFPWDPLASVLNTLVTSYDTFWRVEDNKFPEPEKGVGRPLPEDFNIRGLEWAASYPQGWFENALVDDEERNLELASTAADRKERILWLAVQLAQHCHSLLCDSMSKEFSAAPDVKPTAGQARGSLRVGPFERATSPSSRRTTLQEDDTDMEMEGIEETEVPQDLENDSPEMRELRLQQWRLKNQLRSGKKLIPSGSANANELLIPHYTTVVCDTKLFLSQLDVFWLMISNAGWSVVIPNSVIAELSGFSRNLNSVDRDAARALDAIKSAIEEKKDVAIVTSKGNIVANQGLFYNEQLENSEAEGRRALGDTIADITQQQAQLTRTRRPSVEASLKRPTTVEAKSAILVAEDRAMRLKGWRTYEEINAAIRDQLGSDDSPRGSSLDDNRSRWNVVIQCQMEVRLDLAS
ncbi:MAG: hypothetical protein M1839_001011 [Geoglossum umbratile]|nr:MAG: hypothetical protein M1839_001011 [Geoglossum umbratile]